LQNQFTRNSLAASGYPEAHAYTPKHDFNGMDCTDIVIGMARGSASRVWDYYTRDRSTPRFDTFWGGKNDLTAAMGYEKDGVTTIVFRKKLIGTRFFLRAFEKLVLTEYFLQLPS
jgi:DOMON domain